MKQRVKDDPKVFGLSNLKNGVPISRNGEHEEEWIWGRRFKSSAWGMRSLRCLLRSQVVMSSRQKSWVKVKFGNVARVWYLK